MNPTRALLLASLTILTSLSGCFADEPEEEDPPVVEAPPVVENRTHNVTAHSGQITFQARGPGVGNVVSSSNNDIPNPITTTTNYTGLVVKLEWSTASAATETLALTARPDSDNTDPITTSGASPLRIAIDMSGPAPRTWYIDVTTDDTAQPAAAGANQPYSVTIGQYAGHNGTFDPDWDPAA